MHDQQKPNNANLRTPTRRHASAASALLSLGRNRATGRCRSAALAGAPWLMPIEDATRIAKDLVKLA